MTLSPEEVLLTDVAEVNPRASLGDVPLDESVCFVPMSAMSAEHGVVTATEHRNVRDVRKGFTPFHDGDVLIAKITPCFENGKIGQVRIPTAIGFGSTEFHVVRPHSEKLDGRYLHHFLRQDRVRHEGERRMTGSAGQRRVPAAFVSNLQLRLPPLAKQRRIADILDTADALRVQRRAALAELELLTQTIFDDLFGDPATNPRGWPVSTVGDISLQVTDGEHLTPKRTNDGIKLLSARNVRDGYLDFSNVDYIGQAEHERIKRRCNPIFGDVLISCSGTIGRVARVETTEPFSLVRSAALVRVNENLVRSKFLEHYLRTPALKARMLRRANASGQANLFQGPIKELPVFLPPIPLQDEFARRLSVIESLRNLQLVGVSQLDTLFASLQHRAFNGAL